ncbi:MAG TPA: VOC family protein [Herpetosiphonaceae bacterium]
MKLNHLNLSVTDVPATAALLEKHFGLRPMPIEVDPQTMAFLSDDNGAAITLMNMGDEAKIKYPGTFHIGFAQESEKRVNEIHRGLVADGYKAAAPRRFHGSWTFYFRAPGGFLIEVLC